jgi:predicted 3-demethylubiquinone-9 3-methyltransferase (glyoxalase superfamily)
MKITQKITPFLWFDNNAGQAAEFYVSVFGGESRINNSTPLENTPSVVEVAVLSVTLAGMDFTFINGGPYLKINEAVSFVINCEGQAEVDYFWEKLSAVKESEQCGWLKDRFGVSWQVVPVRLGELLSGKDGEKAARVTQAMLKMKKLDIAELEKA